MPQANVNKNLTQNFKSIKFHFLLNTKMKITITHISVLVKFPNYFIFIFFCAIDMTSAITRNGIKVT